ncbi:hypothetical protein GM556_03500 [Bombella sp. ESL0378]|uniref:hypothetical protein n=1 Tax=unclassified Bombella TaxID=2644098 RepID=UPI0012D86252|nr:MULTISPECIES: hypothetical protein [unclassified Bombella]MUG04615.1 hypothetical protein [Bombella sp. ESL0378]MUG90109.1 hypothetical protein [Bombella sp. ESL0385]
MSAPFFKGMIQGDHMEAAASSVMGDALTIEGRPYPHYCAHRTRYRHANDIQLLWSAA